MKLLAKFHVLGRFRFNFLPRVSFYAVSSQIMLNGQKMRKNYQMLRFGTQKVAKKLTSFGTLKMNTVGLFGPRMIPGMVEYLPTRKKYYFSSLPRQKKLLIPSCQPTEHQFRLLL